MSRVSPNFMLVRLRNQRLAGAKAASAAEVVGWFGAVQAQDYGGAKWALALRTKNARESDVETAFASGAIIRTHVLRPTWHFVLPADLRWMLALTAPRVRQAMAFHDSYYGIDDRTVSRAQAALAKALAGSRHRTRSELAEIVGATGQKLAGILIRAELDALVCSGPRRGKQFTYALVSDRCPPAPRLDRDEALGRLAERYFRSHGPALAQDFAWWSGLTVADARHAIGVAGLESRGGYWSGSWSAAASRGPIAHLLPSFDEFLVAYRVRETRELSQRVLLNGRIVGSWTRLSARLNRAEKQALAAAIARRSRYGSD